MGKMLKKGTISKKQSKLLLILLAVVILSVTAVGYHLTFKNVTILDGKDEINITTRKDTVQEVLEEQEISYIAEDSILPALDAQIEDNAEITIKRAVDVSIEVDGETYELLTPVEKVEDALQQAGIQLGEKDEVLPALEKSLEKGMKIQITRALPVQIEADGKEIELLTTATNVQEVIDEAQLSLGEKDKINPSLDTVVEKDLNVKIIRVTEKIVTEEEDISFDTVRKNTSDMNKGTSKVAQKGQKGIKEKQVQVTYEDGKEVRRETLEEKVKKEPIDQIVKVGTKIKPVVSANRGGNEAVRTLKVVATAYSSQDPGVGNRTSLGVSLRKGVIAVDPSVIPYRTKIYVPGYGFGEALDRGSAIKGNKIDVAFDTRAEALRFGRKTVTIKIYGK